MHTESQGYRNKQKITKQKRKKFNKQQGWYKFDLISSIIKISK